MSAFSDYLENALLNATLKDVDYTSPTSVYVSLHTAAVNDNGSGAEVSGGSYARVNVVPGGWGTVSGGQVANASEITFPQATALWNTVTHFGIWDGPGGGDNLLYWGPLTVNKTVDSGDIFKFPVGTLVIQLA